MTGPPRPPAPVPLRTCWPRDSSRSGIPLGGQYRTVPRYTIDCREYCNDCSLSVQADTQDEVMAVALPHAIQVHGFTDSFETRDALREMMRPMVVA